MTHEKKIFRVLSLGAGVQSSTLLLMACVGAMEKPDAAIFADTGWEPQAVYRHLAWLETQAEQAKIPLYRVSAGNLKEDLLREARGEGTGKTGRMGQPPYYAHNDHPEAEMQTLWTLWGEETVMMQPKDGVGILWRKCTTKYKLNPIRRKARELMKAAGANHIEQWVGISTDEIGRMKPSGRQYITNRHPLIEQQMSRTDCLQWLRQQGFPEPPKSSCLGCPFHSNAMWRQLRDSSPEEWAETVAVDYAIRRGIPGVKGSTYMHRSCVPLDQVNLDHPEPVAEQMRMLPECEGICSI